jgi:hypothetical protein
MNMDVNHACIHAKPETLRRLGLENIEAKLQEVGLIK